jgi:hypothetical protein
LVFEEDGTYKKFQDDSLAVLCSYTVERREVWGAERDMLIIKEPPYSSYMHLEQIIEFENSNKLKLIEYCFDCYEHTYIKQIDEFPTF